LVPISGTPIGSRILIPFLNPKIPVGFFFRIPLLKNQEIRIPIPKFRIPPPKKRRNSIHLITRAMSIVIGQPVGLTMSNHMDVGTIPGKGNLSA
jgi:hypothetical protein